MYHIQTLNSIADVIYRHLPADAYEVSADMPDPDGILVRSAQMHEMTFSPNLKAIARAGAGTNNIPLDRCAEAGIVVFNTPGANANAVRELVMCGMLLSGRRVIEGIEWARTLKGEGAAVGKLVEKGKNQFVGPELKGKTLGIIGMGAIGVLVANAAVNGFEMNVIGYDPYMSVSNAWHLTRAATLTQSLEELFSQSDFISLHLPLMDSTRNTIDAAALASMKDGAVLLNFARGELVDSEAVKAALDSGKLRHYVTDFPNDALLDYPGVIALPHLGASTPESEDNCADMAASQMHDYLAYGTIRNSVNMPACEMAPSAAHRVAVIHRNVANMIGQITSTLASDNLNISNMVNRSRQDYAYTLLDLDVKPSEETLLRIADMDGMLRVRLVY